MLGAPTTATWEWVRAVGKAMRRDILQGPGYGEARAPWDRRALTAYTWLYTDRGSQAS